MDDLNAKNLEDKIKKDMQMPWIERLMRAYPILDKIGYSIV
jgi:hypothetical protein